MRIRMPHRIHRLGHFQPQLPIRLILIRLPPLIQNDIALLVELLLRHRTVQMRKSIRLDIKHHLEHILRRYRVIIRHFLARRRIIRSPPTLQQYVDIGHGISPHKHQVLKQMRKTRPPRLLILRTDVKPQICRHYRQRIIPNQIHIQSILEHKMFKRNIHALLLHGHLPTLNHFAYD